MKKSRFSEEQIAYVLRIEPPRLSWRPVDPFGLVQPVDRLGQRVVVAVALAAH